MADWTDISDSVLEIDKPIRSIDIMALRDNAIVARGQLAAVQASASGTAIDFTGLPEDVKRIILLFAAVSTNGSSALRIQLGDSGGIENTGYLGTVTQLSHGVLPAVGNHLEGFQLSFDHGSGVVYHGMVSLTLMDPATNKWAAHGGLGRTDTICTMLSGSKALSAALDRVRVTASNGTDAFDAGAIGLLYE